MIADKVILPKGLKPGKYILGWRNGKCSRSLCGFFRSSKKRLHRLRGDGAGLAELRGRQDRRLTLPRLVVRRSIWTFS